MKNIYFRVRYWLEIIALPAFVFLVIHLAGHGMMIFFEGSQHSHEHSPVSEYGVQFVEKFFTPEVGFGVLFLVLFTWIWHRSAFKKWVPCRHDHCHTGSEMPHLFAIFAFCLHFFPEASVRHALISQAMAGEFSSFIGVIAFGAHFLVDILVMILLSTYWKTGIQKFFSFFVIIGLWFGAFFFGEMISFEMFSSAKGAMLLLSAFLLAMFVHFPHKTKKSCSGCDHR